MADARPFLVKQHSEMLHTAADFQIYLPLLRPSISPIAPTIQRLAGAT